jgi:gentisate 1,2-dioxygenase
MIASDASTRSEEQIRSDWKRAGVRPLWEIHLARRQTEVRPRVGVWKWSMMQPLVTEALELTSPAVVERRVLTLVDPSALGDEFQSTTNLNGALQILKPGEAARPHRHPMNALRFILSGSGAVTRVDGKTAPMMEGDLVITPGWAWHEHWHDGSEPIIWLDVLDVALHQYLGTVRPNEPGPPHDVPHMPPESAFASANVIPDMPSGLHSPVFRYPFADAVAALGSAPPAPDGSRRVRYVNPLTGGPVMSMLDCYLVELDAGTVTAPFTTSANALCAIVRGRGTSEVGNETIDWEQRDIFALPHDHTIRHRAAESSLLFITTDREIYRRLDLLTEEWGPA